MGVKLYGPHLNDFSVGGVKVERDADGAFDVPPEHVEAAKAHGMRDTKEPPQVDARQPIPASEVDKIHEERRSMERHRDQLITRVRELEQRNHDLEAQLHERQQDQLVRTVNDLRAQVTERDARIRELEKAQADKTPKGAARKGEKE